MGYGIIAVLTGILTTEIAVEVRCRKPGMEACPACGREGHDADARHCNWCAAALRDARETADNRP